MVDGDGAGFLRKFGIFKTFSSRILHYFEKFPSLLVYDFTSLKEWTEIWWTGGWFSSVSVYPTRLTIKSLRIKNDVKVLKID